MYDLIVVGAGAAGMTAAIVASKKNKKVLLVEKLPALGSKLKATGGGKCNLTNTLESDTFMASFGRNGRFMSEALKRFTNKDLIEFFESIGVKTKCSDGFRVFPDTHNSSTVLNALEKELKRSNVKIQTSTKVETIILEKNKAVGIKTQEEDIYADNIILSTGGLGYPKLGTTGDGFDISKSLGHMITSLHPAMMPLHTKETWQANCTADTIPKASIKIDIKKHSKLKARGDLIFTKKGLRGPVILDFAKSVTPLIEKYGEVPVLINMTKGMTQDDIIRYLKEKHSQNPQNTILDHLKNILPESVSKEILNLCHIDQNEKYNAIKGQEKENLVNTLAWTPFTVNGHDGFDKAMITSGGVSLKQIDPNTMKSKIIDNLYFAGEIVDLDGPCGGYNLQWSFSSGNLAGELL